MPLFGSSHKHNKHGVDSDRRDERIAGDGSVGAGAGIAGNRSALGTGQDNNAGPGTGGSNQGYGNDYNYSNQQKYGAGNNPHPGVVAGAGIGAGAATNEPYGSRDGYQGQGGLPPAGALNNSNQTHGGHSTTGKIEHAVGAMIGSSALKAKGLQKEQEASSIKLQSQELAEAERLEREAIMRRERAVAHGAHPDNKYLGGSSSGHSATNTGGAPKW